MGVEGKMTYRVVAAATNHPGPVKQHAGLFNGRSINVLRSFGVNVDVVSPRPFAPPIGPYSEYHQIPTITKWKDHEVHHPRFFYGVPKRLFYGLSGRSYAKRIPSYVESKFEKPDLVQAYHIYLDGYGMIPFSQKHDLPIVAVAHGATLNGFTEFRSGMQSKIRETLEACEVLLCVSEALASRAKNIVPDVDARVVPIGADPSQFPTDEEDTLRKNMYIPQDKPVVFFCGKYVARKGLNEIITVLPELVEMDAQFIFIGQDGPLRSKLERTIRDLNMTDQAYVWHDVSDQTLQESFAIADLLLLPSHSEGRPTVIYEAMASETAVLATDVGGIPEQVESGETGVLIPPGNPNLLRDKLVAMCSDVDSLSVMGRSGQQRLQEQGWTWQSHGERVKEIHEELIGGNQ